VFSNLVEEDLVGLLSDLGFVIESSSVLVDVGSQLSQSVGQSVSGGEEHVVDQVVGVEDISVCIFDFLGEPGDVSVVVVGSPVEVVDQLCELCLEIANELLDGFDQLLEVALGLEVQFGVVEDEIGPI
jgi:hypothetical protein